MAANWLHFLHTNSALLARELLSRVIQHTNRVEIEWKGAAAEKDGVPYRALHVCDHCSGMAIPIDLSEDHKSVR